MINAKPQVSVMPEMWVLEGSFELIIHVIQNNYLQSVKCLILA